MQPGSNLFGTNLCLNDQGQHDPRILLDNITELVNQGAAVVELPADVAALGLLTHDVKRQLLSISTDYTVHLPYASVDTSHYDSDFRRASINLIRRDALTLQALKPRVYILHPHGLKTAALLKASKSTAERDLHLANAVNGLRETVEALLAAGLAPRSIAIENLAGVPFEVFEPVIEEYDLGVCLDIGHWLRSREDPYEFIARFADRLIEVHIHQTFEAQPNRIDHNSLEEAGLVEVDGIVKALTASQFTGPLLLEVKGIRAASASMHILNEALNRRHSDMQSAG